MLSLGTSTNCGRDGVWAFSVHNGLVISDDGLHVDQHGHNHDAAAAGWALA
jgi:hypothetical protein